MDDRQEPTERVLVPDDDPPHRLLLHHLPQQLGHGVVGACDGEEAVELAAAEPPGLVILDVMMPKLDGLEACARIRGLPGGERIPILLLTALSDPECYERAIEAGADDFLNKP